MVDRAVVGYGPFFDIKLLVFPEFAHVAPIYETIGGFGLGPPSGLVAPFGLVTPK